MKKENNGSKSDGPHILFVDDEKSLNLAIDVTLHSRGYKISLCENGKEAVEFYEKNWEGIDLVILDMYMPEMNGKEAFLEMKQINSKINSLIISGYDLHEIAEENLDLGIKGYIEKPFTFDEFLEKIDVTLKK